MSASIQRPICNLGYLHTFTRFCGKTTTPPLTNDNGRTVNGSIPFVLLMIYWAENFIRTCYYYYLLHKTYRYCSCVHLPFDFVVDYCYAVCAMKTIALSR